MFFKMFLLVFFFSAPIFSQMFSFTGKPEIFDSAIVSTEKSEIKVTFSPDGKLKLWGCIGWENGKGGWDIWESRKDGNTWSKPQPATFNSAENDFDPCFSPDGKALYFFSNRPGGFGGDDLYSAAYDPETGTFSSPVIMGSQFNTKGDEWGPSFSPDGKQFIFCTDGLGGYGKHDIFVSQKTESGWSDPVNLSALNSPEDDFDPVILHDNKTIIFTRKISEEEAMLFISFNNKGNFSIPMQIQDKMNVPQCWNLGSSINPAQAGFLYYSTHVPGNCCGRLDVYRIPYEIE